MPIYEYKCKCGKQFERFFKSRESCESAPCEACGELAPMVPSLNSPSVICGSAGPGYRFITTQDKATGSELEYRLKHAEP